MTKNIDERSIASNLKHFEKINQQKNEFNSSLSTKENTILFDRSQRLSVGSASLFKNFLNESTSATPSIQSTLRKMDFIYSHSKDINNRIEVGKPTLKILRDKNESSFNRQGFTVDAP